MSKIVQFIVYGVVTLFCLASLIKGNRMMFENLSFGLAFYIVAAVVLVWMGVSQILSKTLVGGGVFEKAPQPKEVSDGKAWNRKHGIAWIVYGILIAGSFGILTFVPDITVASVAHAIVVVGGFAAYCLYDGLLKKKYLLK